MKNDDQIKAAVNGWEQMLESVQRLLDIESRTGLPISRLFNRNFREGVRKGLEVANPNSSRHKSLAEGNSKEKQS